MDQLRHQVLGLNLGFLLGGQGRRPGKVTPARLPWLGTMVKVPNSQGLSLNAQD